MTDLSPDEQAAVSGPTVATSNEQSNLSAVALVLSFFVPVAGLIIALIVRSKSKREGRTADGISLAALIISSIMIGLGVIAAVIAVSFFVATGNQIAAISGAAAPVPSAAPPTNQVAITVISDGSPVDSGDILTAAKAVELNRLQQANIKFSSFGADNRGKLVTTFSDTASSTQKSKASAVLSVPADLSFRKVLGAADARAGSDAVLFASPEVTQAVADGFTAASCKSVSEANGGFITLDGGTYIYCSPDHTTKFLVGSALITGETIADHSVSKSSIHITFNASGTQLLSSITSDMVSNPESGNRIALISGNQVISSPVAMSVVTNGELSISSDGTTNTDLIDSELTLAAHNVNFTLG